MIPIKNKRPTSPKNLDAYRLSLQLIAELTPTLKPMGGPLATQARRAAPSIALNLCEALARVGRDRAHLLSIALGSAREVRAIIDVALASGSIDAASAKQLDALADRICAMLYRLRRNAA